MRLRMLKHCVGKGRHVMKPLHVCLAPHSVAILRYSGYRARGVCALQSSSYFEWALSIGTVTKANKKELFVTLVDHVP